ncbi:MAG: hypothetical protein RIS44_3174 [Pseudomonadota bacterium]|jgi:peptidyl-prolyl cis-trans isomerase C
MNQLLRFVISVACVTVLSLSSATAQSLIEFATVNNVSVTQTDMMADSLRLPPETRKNMLSRPGAVTQQSGNLLVRRLLAQEAVAEGLDKDPLIAAALQIAREKILSDVRLNRLDETTRPTEEQLSSYARTAYRVDQKKFSQPEQTRVRHILIRNNKPDARDTAEKLLSEIKAGANFEALAKEHSADPGSALKGGDLGFFAAGKMVASFEQAVAALKNPGDLSGLVETQFGFHIIRLEERKPAGMQSFEEVKESLYREAANKIALEARQEKVDQLMAPVKYNEEAIKTFADSQR